MSIVYPKSSTMKELSSVPLIDINYETESTLFRALGGINLKISGGHNEVVPVVKTIFARKSEFFVDAVDNFVFSKMGMEVVIVRFPNKGHDRSLFLELTGVRSEYLWFEFYINMLVFFVALFIEHFQDVKSVIWS